MQKPGLFGMSGFLLFLLTCCSFALHAQQGGSLILIDAENRLPFTVRIGDQLFASSGHGHLIISHLKDSNYKLGFRFPKKAVAEQVFPVNVKQKDLGFQLQVSGNEWILYNWQSKITVRAVKDRDSSRILEMGIKREDGFSRLMAAVVDDTAVLYNTYTGSWFSKDSANNIIKQDQPVANQPVPVQPPITGQNLKQPVVKTQPAVKTPDSVVSKPDSRPTASPPIATPVVKNTKKPAGKPGIIKLRDVNLKISRKMVFLDTGPDGIKDTVTLFVFFETKDTGKKQVPEAGLAKKKPAIPDSAAVAKTPSKNAGADIIIPGCGEQATTADLEWLRSAILKANSEQDKISAASAAFALKCFSVSQLRVLVALFVSDKARYRLMEAAKLHISDRDHFRELADMYTDKNFQKKFLVMADKRS